MVPLCLLQTWDGKSCGCLKLGACAPGEDAAAVRVCPSYQAVPSAAAPRATLCEHLGQRKGTVECVPCSAKANEKVELPLHVCAVHGECTVGRSVPGKACCAGTVVKGTLTPCREYTPKVGKGMKWSYGVTTVPSRRRTLFPRTLASLAAGGFYEPWVFSDGPLDVPSGVAGWTQRSGPAKVFGNWVLALWELYVRNPVADRYAVFQDDIVVYRNLRQYLEAVPYPAKGYLNLYTEPRNEATAKAPGWQPSAQNGYGALALVFTRHAVINLLASDHMVMKPIPADPTQLASQATGVLYRGEHAVDGGIVTSFMQRGWKEYVHNPSLVQHTGLESSFRPAHFPQSTTFRGENFDALTLLQP